MSGGEERLEASDEGSARDDADRRLRLEQLMREHSGNVTAVARAMGKAPTQIRRWLRRFGLEAHDFRR